MKVEEITQAVIGIAGKDWKSLNQELKDIAIADVQFVLDNPKTTPAEWHARVSDFEYKTVKAKEKAVYKNILSTINTLKGIQTGSDEKGDFVECNSISEVEPPHHPNRAINWSDPVLGLATVSGDRKNPEGM